MRKHAAHELKQCQYNNAFWRRFSNVEFVAESTADAINDIGCCAVETIIYLV